jgi:lathosterol oxidase
MDLILQATDTVFFDSFYSYFPSFTRPYFESQTHPVRQFTTLWILEMVGVLFLYFVGSTLSYYFLYDKELKKDKKYLPNQISKEIWLSVSSFPITATVTAPWLFFEVNGYSKLYSNIDDYGWPYFFFSIIWFILFTDFGVYWIHRFEHHPWLYSWLHKPHHQWKICTPFASFAFHPLYLFVCEINVFIEMDIFNRFLFIFLCIYSQCTSKLI